MDSDSVTLKEMKPMQFDEFGNVKGKFLYLDVHKAPLFNDKGELIGVVGTARDITERKQAEEALLESEERNRAILSAFPDLMFVYSREGIYLDFHASDSNYLAAEPENFLHKSVYEVLPKEVADIFMDGFKEASQFGEIQKKEYQLEALGGHKHFEARINPLGQDKYIAIVRDITDRKQAEEALKASEERYREILSTMQEGYYEVDLKGNLIYFNDSFCEAIGYSRDQLLQNSYKILYKDPEEVFRAYHRVYQTGLAEKAFGWPVITKDGREIYVEVSIALRRNKAGEPIGFRGVARDVTERKEAEEKIRYLSFHDKVTGLYNRSFLEEETNRLDTERQLPLSIIMADLNGLKLVNDTYGHKKGDEMLIAAAEMIRNSCREEDIISRWGGDEFVILLPQTTSAEASLICKRITAGCRNSHI